MTTYNPKEYLLEQIESIYNQNGVKVTLIVRDDCSTNKTYLRKAREKFKFDLLEGEQNVGVANNIRELLRYASSHCRDYDYFAYSDQDDVWLSDKIKIAVEHLKNMNNMKPIVYYSNLLVVNEKLEPSHELFRRKVVKNTKGQSLAQVFLFACTSVFNMKMIEEIKELDFSKMGFDSCIYYKGIWQGQAYFDDQPYIKYRQHFDNVSGVKKKGTEYYIDKMKNFRNILKQSTMKDNAQYILDNFNIQDRQDYELLVQVANYNSLRDRLSLMVNRRIRAGYNPKDFFNKIKLLMKCY